MAKYRRILGVVLIVISALGFMSLPDPRQDRHRDGSIFLLLLAGAGAGMVLYPKKRVRGQTRTTANLGSREDAGTRGVASDVPKAAPASGKSRAPYPWGSHDRLMTVVGAGLIVAGIAGLLIRGVGDEPNSTDFFKALLLGEKPPQKEPDTSWLWMAIMIAGGAGILLVRRPGSAPIQGPAERAQDSEGPSTTEESPAKVGAANNELDASTQGEVPDSGAAEANVADAERVASVAPPSDGPGKGPWTRSWIWLAPPLLIMAGTAMWFLWGRPHTVELPPAPDEPVGWKPLLWTIEGPAPWFLFGTIHTPDPSLKSYPVQLVNAIARSDGILTEMPLDAASIRDARFRMQRPGHELLEDLISNSTAQRLDSSLRSLGVSRLQVGAAKIWALALELPILGCGPLDGDPVDVAIWGMGAGRGKAMGGLESVDEQVSLLDDFTPVEQEEMLEDALSQVDAYRNAGRNLCTEMVRVYRSGDEKALLEAMTQWVRDNPRLNRKIVERVLLERNKKMADRIERRLRSAPIRSVVIAVGAAHLVGPDSIVALLQQKGLRVQRQE
ncbi:MAG: TraB/GumN family protein [Deltaproteobacteria bacterium]|nr:TraB/GumN family protein [Deltaproteobacteria bacterium]